MNVPDYMEDTSPPNDAIVQAERWFVRRREGGCTKHERAAFDAWRAVPEHAAAYAATERLWAQIGDLAGQPELERMVAEADIATRRQRHARRRRPGWLLPAAAAACAVIVVGILLLVFPSAPAPTVYATGPAKGRTVSLADGSRVTLNINTTIAVRMHAKDRDVRLRHGEALFDVAHDPHRPFQVSVGGGQVTALGTRFVVSNLDRHVLVTLLRGSVAVDRSALGEHVRLQPGQQAAFTVGRGRITKGEVDTHVITSWTHGRLLFRSTPLSKVIAEVNRYAATPLRLAAPSLASTPVSGTFPMGDSRSVAFALQAMLPLRVDTSTPGQITLRRRQQAGR